MAQLVVNVNKRLKKQGMRFCSGGMGKPKFTEQVADKVNRKVTDFRDRALERIQSLTHLVEVIPGISDTVIRDEMIRHVPVALIATLEGWFRHAVALLADSYEQYSSNATQLLKKNDLDSGLLLGLQTKKMTLGDIVSRSISCNHVDNITEAFQTIIGSNLENAIKAYLKFDFSDEDHLVLYKRWDTWKTEVEKVFVLRHIFAHEITSTVKLTVPELEKQILVLNEFIRFMDTLTACIEEAEMLGYEMFWIVKPSAPGLERGSK